MPIIPVNVGVYDAISTADETASDRLKVNSAIRLLDLSQSSGTQLVVAKGDQTSGMWVNVKETSLPTGAATTAKQPALGTAGTASTDVLTVQGIASMTALKVDGSAVTQPVSGTFWQATQPVSGTVTANAGTGTLAVSAASLPLPAGAATEASLAKTTIAQSAALGANTQVMAGGSVTTANPSYTNGNINPLSLTTAGELRVILPTGGGGLTDTELRATPVPVSGTFWQATQPVSGTIGISGSVAVTGPLTDAQLRAVAVPVSGTVTANIGTSGSLGLEATQVKLTIAQSAALGTNTLAMVGGAVLTAQPVYVTGNINPLSITTGGGLRVEQVHTGKANTCKTGNLVTTAVTADQVILTYTVTAGKTFFLMGIQIQVRLTTYAATALPFGAASLESPAATKLNTFDMPGTGNSIMTIPFTTPIEIAAGAVVRIVCTPLATTSYTWKANFFGYEK